MDQYEQINRGNAAKELLENPLLVEAFTAISDKLHKQWADSPARDFEGREKLWQMLSLLKMLEGHIKKHITDGKTAEILLEEEKKRKLLKFF